MPEVSCSVSVAAPPATVYAAAQDVEGLARFIPALERITVDQRLERPQGPETVTSWVGLLPEFNRRIKWTERDLWDDQTRRCDFTLVKGDLDRYEGEWLFEEADDGCRCTLTVRYEYDVPLIGALIKGLFKRKMQESVDGIQAGLKQRAETA